MRPARRHRWRTHGLLRHRGHRRRRGQARDAAAHPGGRRLHQDNRHGRQHPHLVSPAALVHVGRAAGHYRGGAELRQAHRHTLPVDAGHSQLAGCRRRHDRSLHVHGSRRHQQLPRGRCRAHRRAGRVRQSHAARGPGEGLAAHAQAGRARADPRRGGEAGRWLALLRRPDQRLSPYAGDGTQGHHRVGLVLGRLHARQHLLRDRVPGGRRLLRHAGRAVGHQ